MNSYFIQSKEQKKQHILSSLNLNKKIVSPYFTGIQHWFLERLQEKNQGFFFSEQQNLN